MSYVKFCSKYRDMDLFHAGQLFQLTWWEISVSISATIFFAKGSDGWIWPLLTCKEWKAMINNRFNIIHVDMADANANPDGVHEMCCPKTIWNQRRFQLDLSQMLSAYSQSSQMSSSATRLCVPAQLLQTPRSHVFRPNKWLTLLLLSPTHSVKFCQRTH